jgi:signal transduction histidine kinase
VLAIVLGAVVFALVRSFTSSYETLAATDLVTELRQFQQGAVARPANQGLKAYAVRFLETHPLAAGATTIVSVKGAGVVVAGRSGAFLADARVKGWIDTPPPVTTDLSAAVRGVTYEFVVAPIMAGDNTVGSFIAASDLSPFVAEQRRVLGLSLSEAAIALAVGVLSAFLLLRSLLRRIGRITMTADEIGSGTLEQRLGDHRDTDEVGALARTFDAMLDRLDSAMRSQRRLLSDVSHQLRTPVTVARGHLEVLNRVEHSDVGSMRETLELVIDELDHMTGLIERLMTLGRAMEPELLTLEQIDLREFSVSLLEAAQVLAPRRFVLASTARTTVLADRQQLRGALLNLLENAVRATEPGDSISLGSTVEPSGAVRLEVEDSGPGIPEAHRLAALERFARPGARNEGGTGLGLAIAKAVAIAHGGTIAIDRSPVLGGARVAIILPPGGATKGAG